MPLYTITHTTPLSSTKKDKLASALTTLHSTKFTTAKMFVNVRFVNAEHNRLDTYVAGKSMSGKENNYLEAQVRAGSERPKELFNELAAEMVKIWEEIVSFLSFFLCLGIYFALLELDIHTIFFWLNIYPACRRSSLLVFLYPLFLLALYIYVPHP
jgi:phenylpyruvate tautomerase PptA (4-oxalocrotonate tautomerase family)